MEIQKIYLYMKNHLSKDKTGHDLSHIKRVENIALRIAHDENIDSKGKDIILAAIYLHDTIDEKIVENIQKAQSDALEILKESNVSLDDKKIIMDIILNMSYSKNLENKKKLNKLGQIVQDADRIDALGAIGIARTFYYGGTKGSPIYDDKNPRRTEELNEGNYRDEVSVVNHFYEKLLHLESSMNTRLGKEIASKRTEYMRNFLKMLYSEIEGER